MADRISKEARSENMRRIRGKNTLPEIALRRALWSAGLRGWRVNYKALPGSPDIVFPKKKVVVFIDGCFWHGCPRCGHYPKTNTLFWKAKIERNRTRDRRTRFKLRREGFKVLRFWEHEIRGDISRSTQRIQLALLSQTAH